MSTRGRVRRYARNGRRRRGVRDLSVPPVENLEQAGGPVFSVDQSGQGNVTAIPGIRGGQIHHPAGSTQPALIDVEELDDDVVISSPRAFEEAIQRSQRTSVADMEAEEVAIRLGLNHANKRRRGHPTSPIINRESVNLEGSTGYWRERALYIIEYLKSTFLNLVTRGMQLHSSQRERAQYVAPPPPSNEPTINEFAVRRGRNQANKRRRGHPNPPSLNCEIYSYLEGSSSYMRDIASYVAPPPLPPPKEPSFSCPVCMDPIVEEVTTKCGHIFCKACITAAIKAQRKCPTCRQKLTIKNLIRVYLPITM